jgi:1-acyl-sn-glycerol-3-phosphate acyltransferase
VLSDRSVTSSIGSAVNATGSQLDRKAGVEAQALGVVRQVLGELGSTRGLVELAARGPAAHLERELGLGSLERVELMLRLGDTCGVRLPDRVVAEADTVQDLIDAILREESEAVTRGANANGAVSASPTALPATSAPGAALFTPTDLAEKIRSAETLTEIIRLRGRGEPARAHILLYEEGDDPREITFGELYDRSSAVATELQKRGLGPGQTVAIMLPTCAEFFFTFAGVLFAGGIPVPIYPPIRADRITEYAERQSSILRNAEAQFLVTFRRAEGLARLLQPRVPTLRGVLNAERLAEAQPAQEQPSVAWRAVENLSHQPRADDIAFLQYTSGSTGDPKGVTLTHANLLANIRSIVAGIGFVPEDVAVSWLPLYHDMGLIGAWFVPLFSGHPLVAMSPLAFLSRPERWLRAVHRHRGSISPAPNFAYELCVRKIADKDLQGLDLSCWRAALNGAEPVHAGTMDRFAARFAPYGFRREALLPVYGLAEASLGISVRKIGSGYHVDRIERDAFESSRRAIPAATIDKGARGDQAAPDETAPLEFVGAGRPLPEVEVRVVDADGREVEERVEGQLWFRSPAATSGYYRNPAATREIMREGGWLNSSDYAYLADGEIYITGRAKDVIIKGGRNLYPHEIEQVAGRVEGVRPGCVVAFGAPDARSGTEKLVVAAEVRGRGASIDEKRILAEISRAVNEAMGVPPDQIELLPPQSIPKTSSGKLRRNETRRLFLAGELGKKLPPAWMQMARLGARGAVPRAWKFLKRGAKTAAESFYGVYALTVFALVLIPLWLAGLLTRDPRRAARLIHRGSRFMILAAGIRVQIENEEILRAWASSGPWIFAPNHSSYLDIVTIVAYLPADVRYVVKGEVLRMPFFGLLARRSGQFAFNRSDPQARIQQAQDVNAALGRGESVVIYPEGTFTAIAGLRPFQLGAFKAAAETQRPICPVAVRGARTMLRDGTYLPRPGRITMVLGPLIAPDPPAGANWQEVVRLRDLTREIIGRNAGEPLL